MNETETQIAVDKIDQLIKSCQPSAIEIPNALRKCWTPAIIAPNGEVVWSGHDIARLRQFKTEAAATQFAKKIRDDNKFTISEAE